MKTSLLQFDDGLLNKRWALLARGPEGFHPEDVAESEQDAPEQAEQQTQVEDQAEAPENIEETLGKVQEVDKGFAEKVTSLVGSADATELALAKEFVDKPMLTAFFEQHEELRRGSEANRQEVLSGVQAATSPVETPTENT